ncbi:hypothetical protein GCM10007881_58540 [Mesorhizobium huakuii]|nr:hypothetical protein GCM10007881_58540 [Mesorhizobium huakuii]
MIALFEPLILALANGRARRDGTILAVAFCPGAKARTILSRDLGGRGHVPCWGAIANARSFAFDRAPNHPSPGNYLVDMRHPIAARTESAALDDCMTSPTWQ